MNIFGKNLTIWELFSHFGLILPGPAEKNIDHKRLPAHLDNPFLMPYPAIGYPINYIGSLCHCFGRPGSIFKALLLLHLKVQIQPTSGDTPCTLEIDTPAPVVLVGEGKDILTFFQRLKSNII